MPQYRRHGGTYENGYRVLQPGRGFTPGWTFFGCKPVATGAVALEFGILPGG